MARQDNARPDYREPLPSIGPRLGRNARIGHEQVRQVRAGDVVAGDVLPLGLVVMSERIGDDQRIEVPGSTIIYEHPDEPVTVLARVDDEVLDAISVALHIARHPARV